MSALVVHPLDRPLVGGVPVPRDGVVAQRAIVFAALCGGVSELRGVAPTEDVVATTNALRALGIAIEDGAKGVVRVTGKGLFGLAAPAAAIDCGRSRSTARLLAGLLAPQPFRAELAGEGASLSDVVPALLARGARIEGDSLPLVIGPLAAEAALAELEWASETSSADVKGAILLSGLFAHGTTWFKEPAVSRDHTERMMHALGVPLRTLGTMVELDPGGWDGAMTPFVMDVPGDVTAAAYLLVAAQMFAGSRVTVRNVGTNPTRTGFCEISRLMGAGVDVVPTGESMGEPVGEITAWHSELRGALVGGELVARAEGEIPILCALAARARGTTTIRDATELRAPGRDVLEVTATVLREFGVTTEALDDGIRVEGKDGLLLPAVVASGGDARTVMLAAVLALAGKAPSRIEDCDALGTTFPRFVGTLRALGARIDVES